MGALFVKVMIYTDSLGSNYTYYDCRMHRNIRQGKGKPTTGWYLDDAIETLRSHLNDETNFRKRSNAKIRPGKLIFGYASHFDRAGEPRITSKVPNK